MAISDISITSGMRSNLLQLTQTSELTQRTQTRLASGKKVNSALDNPTNFFAAQSATQRAGDLADKKDGMSQAVQTVQAANAGISAITSLVSAAKGLAQSAISTSDTNTRSTLSTQYDTIRSQIDNLASDSGYNGMNLLAKTTGASGTIQTLTVNFNEKNTSSLNVVGIEATSSGLSISATSGSWASTSNITSDAAKLDTALSTLRSNSQSLAANLSVVTTRQSFTDNMINTLQTGSDNLTLADMNEEGANMLALQTRQSLATSSLSMSSQAAQSVMKLF